MKKKKKPKALTLLKAAWVHFKTDIDVSDYAAYDVSLKSAQARVRNTLARVKSARRLAQQIETFLLDAEEK